MAVRLLARHLVTTPIALCLGLMLVFSAGERPARAADHPPCTTLPNGTHAGCLVVDTQPALAGEQDGRVVGAGEFFYVDVVVRPDPEATALGSGSFELLLTYSTEFLSASVPTLGPSLNAANWDCTSAGAPDNDLDGLSSTGDAWISCAWTGSGLIPDPGNAAIARFPLSVYPCCGFGQSAALDLAAQSSWTEVFDASSIDCDDINGPEPAGGCHGGFVYFFQHGFPDADADFRPDYDDNCPYTPNGSQENNDRNFIDLPASEPFDDATRANSDTAGDACDPDDDNDGRPDADETSGTGCGGAVTDPLNEDSDGDYALDGAECTIGTDPASAASKPTNAQCGSGMDSDADGIVNYREVCNYGTDPNNDNTDGDGCNDGREMASINGDMAVNVLDLQQVAQHAGPASDPDYIVNYDVTKNGSIDVIDLQQVAARTGNCP